MSWVVAAWERLPARLRVALALLFGALAAGIALFFRGKRAGKVEGAAEELTAAAERDVERIHETAARGDDAGVQRELASALEEARRRRKGKR